MTQTRHRLREAAEPDFGGIEALFEGHDSGPPAARNWASWKYRCSPDGPARVFVAEDPGGEIVGTLAYLPRRFTGDTNAPFVVMQVVDAFLRSDLRRGDTFLRLRQFARERVAAPWLGLPNASSSVFALRSGWRVLAPQESWRFPVRMGELLSGARRALAGPAANAASRVYQSFYVRGHAPGLRMQAVDAFTHDYATAPDLIRGIRSAGYLNWRFLRNPLRRYQAYEFSDGDGPVGYCVYARRGSAATLADLVVDRHGRDCLGLLLEHCRADKISHLSFTGVGLELEGLGFVRHGANGNCTVFGGPEGRWMVTPCDTDSGG